MATFGSVEPHADGPANGEVWHLKVERETLCAPAHRDKLQAALTALLGYPVKLKVDCGATDDNPARRDAEREVDHRIGIEAGRRDGLAPQPVGRRVAIGMRHITAATSERTSSP